MRVHLGNCLKQAIKTKPIWSAELARKLNVKPQQIHQWTQKQDLMFSSVMRITTAFDMSVDEFIALGNDEQPLD